MAKNVICIQASAKDCLVQPVRLQTKTLSLEPNTIVVLICPQNCMKNEQFNVIAIKTNLSLVLNT